jgi:hypothetical protein
MFSKTIKENMLKNYILQELDSPKAKYFEYVQQKTVLIILVILTKAHKVLNSANSGIRGLNCIQGKDVCLHFSVLCFPPWVEAL